MARQTRRTSAERHADHFYVDPEMEVLRSGIRELLHYHGTIFVFGSNLAGIHGAGAAWEAATHFGAARGVGEGMTGQAYALPTKDKDLEVRPLEDIRVSVERFLDYAEEYPAVDFFVTRVGCGFAGYTDADIAPMFRDAPLNCVLPDGWGI